MHLETKSNEPTAQRPTEGRSLDAPQPVLDLPTRLAQVRQEPAYQTSDQNFLTLFKTDALRIVLLALHVGIPHSVRAVTEAAFLRTLAVP